MFDNRVFNVNGNDRKSLEMALQLAFDQRGSNTKVYGYIINKEKGMILLWTDRKDMVKLPSPITAKAAGFMVSEWLKTDPEIECDDWDGDFDHDGHNSKGWRVYCENWGHVADLWEAIVAIKPVYLWHGK